MGRKRTTHGAAFKSKVTLAAVRGLKTTSELASEFGVHPTLIAKWKRQLVEGAEAVFSRGGGEPHRERDGREAELYQQIGKLQREREWVKKKLPPSTDGKRGLVEPEHAELSVRRQCELLGLARSTWYLEPVGESEENLRLMRRIDEQSLRTPFYGSRRMALWRSQAEGRPINRKRVRRLMQVRGIEAIYPKPRTTQKCPEHRIFPYLLRDVEVIRPNQVWASDITYVPMACGFLYLVAVIDWYSRHVLSWRLSNTLDGGFCLEALEEALASQRPEIFNTDRGVQFTARAFTSRLEQAGVAVSMDGKGRAIDNVFVERLWRTVKYEDGYLKEYQTGLELEAGLSSYFRFYGHERPHQSLGYRTPAAVYFEG